MKNLQKRLSTIILLVKSSTAFADPAVKQAVIEELREISRIANLQPLNRRRLLVVLHLARSLETSLRSVVDSNGIVVQPEKRGMGGYLTALATHTPPLVTQSVRHNCIRDVTKLRNRIAHAAGGYPRDDGLVEATAQAAHACLALILR
ncbi:hypothetical protein ELI02_18690 [Rhizobium leguminosarum]|uniref:hypothetical protein n=1 Tax=Rhizobium leguminosarum TaxID=384 RepID=UPI0010323E3A|nr:hypothetical protein [Rhizobium leguminosarum]TAX57565.1 hypothetical protein ELI01_21130 [Rhizobium leguminosarum]TAX61907.1 hypothetical protein ELI02_18690 [Rhizobium leguminosarum]TAY03436.1 hypothetical protein ELH95_21195 [Rhizobium leguminosarum]